MMKMGWGLFTAAFGSFCMVALADAQAARRSFFGRVRSVNRNANKVVVVERGQEIEVTLPPERRIFLRAEGIEADVQEGRTVSAAGRVSDDKSAVSTRNLVIYTGRDRGDAYRVQPTVVVGTLSREGADWYVAHPRGRVKIVPAGKMARTTLDPGTAADIKPEGRVAGFGLIGNGKATELTMFHIYKEDASDRAKSAFEGEVVSSDREIVRELVGEHVFENLGAPVPPKPPQPTFMTTSESGQNRFWVYQRAPGHYKIFGLDIETGQAVTLDMAEHVADSNAHICMFPYQDRYLYIWAGRHPGRFFRYEIASGALTPLGDGFADMAYVLGYAVEDTERMFIGAYPSTRVASVDFGRDTVRDWGRLAEDERQMYIIGPVVGGDGMLYCPVGLHHGELYAVNLRSGEKKQIIPEGWEGKIPVVWALEDGTVWGRMGERRFRCRADGVDLIDKDNEPGYAELRGSGWQYKSPWPYRNGDAFRAGAWRFLQIQSRGGADRLVLEHADTKERHGVALDTTVSAGGQVYSIGDVFGGRIYGGTISPSQTFSYDPSNNTFRYYPRFFGGGRIQVYDILRLPGGGMLQSSYTNAALDWFDPSSPEVLGENPRVVARLAASDEQERIFYLRHGPDGQVYFGTTPVKGLLGGALGRYRPDDHSVRLWRDILPDQSIRDATAVPETGEVFGAGSISGGTSAIPSETEADVFLWDCAKEKVAWTGKPIAGATDYLRVVRAPNGHLVGIARTPAASVYYVFDPRNRETLFTGELASGPGRLPHVCDNPLPTGEIIGSSGNAIYAIDAGTGKMRILVEHPSLGHLHGMEYHDGWLYYGSLSHIWRVKL